MMHKVVAQLLVLVVIAACIVNMASAVDAGETKDLLPSAAALPDNDETGDMDAQEHKYKYVVHYKYPHYKTKSYHYQPKSYHYKTKSYHYQPSYPAYGDSYPYQQPSYEPQYGGDYGSSY